MAGKYADKIESLRPITGLVMRRQHRPFHSQFRGHVRCCLLLQEYSKLPKTLSHAAQLESQAAPERNVIVDGLSQRLHRLAPGHGRAMERSDTKSTLAYIRVVS